MESCARVISMFPEYADGELPPTESGRVSSHLERCGACARRVERQRNVIAALEALPQVVPPGTFRDSVMARVMAAPLRAPSPRPQHLRLVRTVLYAALAFAAGSAGIAGAFLRGRDLAGTGRLLDPSLYAEWAESLGRVAFSFLLDIATRAALPGALPAPHSPVAWGGLVSVLIFTGLAAGAVGLGVLATARVLLGPRAR